MEERCNCPSSLRTVAVGDEGEDVLPLSGVRPRRGEGTGLSNPGASRVTTDRRPPGRVSLQSAPERPDDEGGSRVSGGNTPCEDLRAPGAGEKGRCSSACCSGSCEAGDIVWAKVSRQTWRTGVIRKSKGSTALVSFFGSGRTRWFHGSRILGFEENYVPLAERGEADTEGEEVGFALAELGCRTALALRCGYLRQVDGAGNIPIPHIEEVRRGFDPSRVLDFVQNVAVHTGIDVEASVGAVKAAAQLNAYRRHVSFSQIGEAEDRGFWPAALLDFVLSVAVSAFHGSEEEVSVSRAVSLVHLCRRFLSANPEWVYRRPDKEMDDSTTEVSTSSSSEVMLCWLEIMRTTRGQKDLQFVS